jgi:hypothetical protein
MKSILTVKALLISTFSVLVLLTCSAFQSSLATETSQTTNISLKQITYLDQGWSPEIRELFYFTPQGSQLMPYKWFLSLETAGNTTLFSAIENLTLFGWVMPTGSSELNPDGLPVGFAKDPVNQQNTGQWVGLTCSACHTSNITKNGTTIRIDGAPANIDIDTFFSSLSAAANATWLDEKKFLRFATRVIGHPPSDKETSQLRSTYLPFVTTLIGQTWMRTPPLPAGPGRIDALGQIVNALAVFELKEADNLRPSSAPVSYPFLWYTPRLAWVQWNPIAGNPIARNSGEVLGAFGHANFTASVSDTSESYQKDLKSLHQKMHQIATDIIPPEWRQDFYYQEKVSKSNKSNNNSKAEEKSELFSSTVLFKNLFLLEKWITDLKQPTWNEKLFGVIDSKLAGEGAELFTKDCRSCHNMPPFDLTAKKDNIIGKQFIKIGRINYKTIGTDPLYVQNLLTRFTKTGMLGPIIFENKPVVPAGRFFLGSVKATVEKGLDDLGLTAKEKLAYSDYRFYPPEPGKKPLPYTPPSIDSLKAGPLLGIWATGPFLHNGSIPNIYELLSPPEERSTTFWVGNQELNTEKLGFVSDQQAGYFKFDTRLPGNHNSGHIYPNKPYTHHQRLALIEYLKNPMSYVKEVVK